MTSSRKTIKRHFDTQVTRFCEIQSRWRRYFKKWMLSTKLSAESPLETARKLAGVSAARSNSCFQVMINHTWYPPTPTHTPHVSLCGAVDRWRLLRKIDVKQQQKKRKLFLAFIFNVFRIYSWLKCLFFTPEAAGFSWFRHCLWISLTKCQSGTDLRQTHWFNQTLALISPQRLLLHTLL